jgi:UDP-N-acetylmuramoyl-L-alanyl-D-glutamate--2,6-diaminopimelate ligase
LAYGIEAGDVHASGVQLGRDGVRFSLRTPSGTIDVNSPLLGRVNVQNILAASAAALARGCSLEQIRRGIAQLKRVPGRFERVDCGQPFTGVVDYAHTDDALRNLLRLAREFVGPSNRVITVFGCGGDRDRTKRPRMGRAAGEASDLVVLTSDNPRSEDPLAIIQDARAGLEQTSANFSVELDRRKAIALAINQAQPGDIVLLAGKGHEKVQVLATGAVPFDDVAVAADILQSAGFAAPARSTA